MCTKTNTLLPAAVDEAKELKRKGYSRAETMDQMMHDNAGLLPRSTIIAAVGTAFR